MTRKEAELFFRKYGGSDFFMGREEPARYNEYKELEISQVEETAWLRDEILLLRDGLRKGALPAENLWVSIGALSALVVRDASEDSLRDFAADAEFLRSQVPPENRILVAECIFGSANGYGQRHGPFFLALKLGARGIAQDLLATARRYLAAFAPSESVNPDRYQRALGLCEASQERLQRPENWSTSRDYLAEVKSLCAALEAAGLKDRADRLRGAISAGATGNEIAMAVRYELAQLIDQAPQLDEALRIQASSTVDLLNELLD